MAMGLVLLSIGKKYSRKCVNWMNPLDAIRGTGVEGARWNGMRTSNFSPLALRGSLVGRDVVTFCLQRADRSNTEGCFRSER